ncbi:cupin domain-containing protein [Pontimicrobium sp. IMCC45349]|uniref:cupin domain-containing protein n=1 Tax=Pontimicrobium sp. IMCC45349 TaxID=3391574 RepID=UPI0039A044B7
MDSLKALIETLELQPHPEGGYYKETYRSKDIIVKYALPKIFNGNRNHSTGIYYLLESKDFSAFHRINQDEMWHFYKGSTLILTMISDKGELSTIKIGNDITNGETPQAVVPKGYWFAAKVEKPESYALLGCTVAPGFDFQDFELAERNKLIAEFPQHKNIITTLTRD